MRARPFHLILIPPMSNPRYVIYDGDCSLCLSFKDMIVRLDRTKRITPIPLRDPRVAPLLSGLTDHEIRGSFHLVWDNGRRTSGDQAIPDILRLLPLGRLPAWCLEHVPGLGGLNQRIYRWIAFHRPRKV